MSYGDYWDDWEILREDIAFRINCDCENTMVVEEEGPFECPDCGEEYEVVFDNSVIKVEEN